LIRQAGRTWLLIDYRSPQHICERQILVTSLVIEVLILDTDAGEIPAILATCRTPLPDARNCLAFSTFGFAIGGLPNLIDRARAAA
jgi:hypothetical protein